MIYFSACLYVYVYRYGPLVPLNFIYTVIRLLETRRREKDCAKARELLIFDTRIRRYRKVSRVCCAKFSKGLKLIRNSSFKVRWKTFFCVSY